MSPLNSPADGGLAPSPWVLRHLYRLPPGGRVLDLACGGGRHARLLAQAGHAVLAVDRDEASLTGMAGLPGITTRAVDLERDDWPLGGESFAAIVVTNYLWRPRLDSVLALLAPGGVLIYETFMVGHERYGKPSRPDFLLRSQELLEIAQSHRLTVLAYEEGESQGPTPAVRQALCAQCPIEPVMH